MTHNHQKIILVINTAILVFMSGTIVARTGQGVVENQNVSLGGSNTISKQGNEVVELKEQLKKLAKENEKLKSQIKSKDDEYYFKVWKSHEDVAMHFNDLIIRLRVQSIGGLASLAVILGIFLQKNNGSDKKFKCGLAIIAIIFLMFCWAAIRALDLQYYDRLLEGSVNAILEIEKDREGFLKSKQINLSTDIEKAFHVQFKHEISNEIKINEGEIAKNYIDGRDTFYTTIFIALGFLLFVTIVMCVCQCCKSKA